MEGLFFFAEFFSIIPSIFAKTNSRNFNNAVSNDYRTVCGAILLKYFVNSINWCIFARQIQLYRFTMRVLFVVFVIVLYFVPSRCLAQDTINKAVSLECVNLDSLEITNKKLLKEIDTYYNKTKELMDTNSFFRVFINRFEENDSNSYLFYISLGEDLENEMQWVRENKSGYFRYNNTLVLIPFLNDSIGIYKRANKKLFCFNRREFVTTCGGHCSKTEAGFKIKKTKASKIKIRKLYFFKSPYSKVKRLFYRIRYRHHF